MKSRKTPFVNYVLRNMNMEKHCLETQSLDDIKLGLDDITSLSLMQARGRLTGIN